MGNISSRTGSWLWKIKCMIIPKRRPKCPTLNLAVQVFRGTFLICAANLPNYYPTALEAWQSIANAPDRIFGFSVSYAAGLSLYDWYADLPPAGSQVWGDQTDVPESSASLGAHDGKTPKTSGAKTNTPN